MAHEQGIRLKKKFGQHFLKDQGVVDRMTSAVPLSDSSSVFEIGCGEGFLTRTILKKPLSRLWVFEIDPDWAHHVSTQINDKRLTVFKQDILCLDFKTIAPHAPWIVLANLPYQITFPILHKFQENRALIKEGVIMVQEEVAQKIVKMQGRGYGFPALFFQHYFEWKLMEKILPSAFNPPPKVDSRLLHFITRERPEPIEKEEQFWQFVKTCFKQPRRTLKNNLLSSYYAWQKLDSKQLELRAQQLTKEDFLKMWNMLSSSLSDVSSAD